MIKQAWSMERAEQEEKRAYYRAYNLNPPLQQKLCKTIWSVLLL